LKRLSTPGLNPTVKKLSSG